MEVKTPTDGEKRDTANVFKNVAVLLKKSMHFGDNAGYVNEAIVYLENLAVKLAPEAAAAEAAAKLAEVPSEG